MYRLVVVSCLALISMGLRAQAPAVLSTQGRLLSGTTPVTGAQTLTFRLYATVAGGSALWEETHAGVMVTDGVYDVLLGATTPFGPLDLNRQLYLGVQVGTAAELAPRTPLTAVPAALTLSAPSVIKGAIDGTVLGVENTDSRANHRAVAARATGLHSVAVLGEAVGAESGDGVGVRGTTESAVGTGVQGISTATTGLSYGVTGASMSADGSGVYGSGKQAGVEGWADDTGLQNSGVRGASHSAAGVGVHGWATKQSGVTYGVLGEVSSGHGTGIQGLHLATQGGGFAVRGDTYSSDGTGVLGSANSATGETVAIWGQTVSPDGYSGRFLGGKGVLADRLTVSGVADPYKPQLWVEEEGSDWARVRLRNRSNEHYWDVAGGSASNTILNFYHSQRGNVLSLRSTGSPLVAYNGAYLSEGGAWTDVSSADAKTDFAAADPASIVQRLAMLPIQEWSYRTEPGVRHLGPTAEDFFAAFGLGKDTTSLAPLDVNGVALVAIQALLERVETLERETRRQADEIARLLASR